MYCTQCGSRNDDEAIRCANCGSVLPRLVGPGAGEIRSYLAESILVTLCCCLPLGIPAIVFAAQVNSKAAAGDVAGAMESARQARNWCIGAFAAGLLGIGIYAALAILGALQQ
jgi:Interferon-induced transmembrane protein/zinc-ribbon domain